MYRWPLNLALCMIVCVGVFAGSSFSEDRSQHKEPLKQFRLARRYYRGNDYARAASAFYQSMTSASAKKHHKIRYQSEWGLAQSMEKMELFYSASMYLSRIVRRGDHKSNPYFRKSLVNLGKINNEINLGQSHIVQLFKTKISYASIPGIARGFYFYYKGVESFEDRQYKSAQGFFKRVQQESHYYIKSLFYLGVIANISGQSEEGLAYFKKVKNLSSESENPEWLREQADLNIARIHYEMKNYREAISHYSEIPRQSDNWLQALFEAAWAFFLMEKANNTLGNIHTLHSPFFMNRFFPESTVLQSITFLRLCRYDQAKESLEYFKKRYSPVIKDMISLLGKSKDKPEKFFRYVYDYRTGRLKDFNSTWMILDALSRTDSYKQAGSTIKNADNEIVRLADAPSDWNKIGLLSDLKKFLMLKKKAAVYDTGKRLYRQGYGFYQYLNELSDQTKLITAELLLGKVDNLRAKLNIETSSKKENFIGGMKPLQLGQELEYWPFEGEYWEDELGGYVYNIASRCRKSGS